MMKKQLMTLLLGGAVGMSSLWALRPGDVAEELSTVTWLQGGPVSAKDESGKMMKAVVFLRTRSGDAAETLQMLQALNVRFPDMLQCAAITPDSPADAAALLKQSGVSTVSFGTDSNFALTGKYMESFPVFPMAFLTAPDGTIIWCGEAADLPEAMENAAAGKLKTSDQRKLSEHLDRMLTALREGKHDLIGKLSADALKLDPGNAGILRLRLFDLESRYHFKEAFHTVMEEIKKVPKRARLYMLAWELTVRHAELAHERHELLEALQKADLRDEEINILSWQLLQNTFDADVLKTAVMLQKKIADKKEGLSPVQQASFDTTRALLLYRLGKPAEAYEIEKKLPELWKKAGILQNVAPAEKRAEFYKAAAELGK
jgi:hypothetical protein